MQIYLSISIKNLKRYHIIERKNLASIDLCMNIYFYDHKCLNICLPYLGCIFILFFMVKGM